jgi:hypothetical protein
MVRLLAAPAETPTTKHCITAHRITVCVHYKPCLYFRIFLYCFMSLNVILNLIVLPEYINVVGCKSRQLKGFQYTVQYSNTSKLFRTFITRHSFAFISIEEIYEENVHKTLYKCPIIPYLMKSQSIYSLHRTSTVLFTSEDIKTNISLSAWKLWPFCASTRLLRIFILNIKQYKGWLGGRWCLLF